MPFIKMKKLLLLGLFIAIVIAVFVSPFASSNPDGLEKVAENKNFLHNAKNIFTAPIPDYSLPGINNKTIAGSLAGATGVVLVFALAYGIGFCLKNKKSKQ